MDLDQQQFILPEVVSHEPAPGTEVIEDGSFSYEGYEVVRGEFFSHIYEPSVSFKDCRVQFNTACLVCLSTNIVNLFKSTSLMDTPYLLCRMRMRPRHL